MHTFQELSKRFSEYFNTEHFPGHPASLYAPNNYFLQLGGKRIRPVLVLLANELFEDIHEDAWKVSAAIELFHNFTLIHDDIMDEAPQRRGRETLPKKYGINTAILAGDVMMVKAYSYINEIHLSVLHSILSIFNKTAAEVCEGQQLDMDFEKETEVDLPAYMEMIKLKTSVLLAASLKMGAILGQAGERNQNLIYEFGLKLGIAFQMQDDYLDAFGENSRTGKQIGGDILANKKTFLWIHAMENASAIDKAFLQNMRHYAGVDKVDKVLAIFESTGVKEWALTLKEQFYQEAMAHLDDIVVISHRKQPLRDLAGFLIKRDY